MKRINWLPGLDSMRSFGFTDGSATKLSWTITNDRPTGSSVVAWSVAGNGQEIAGGASLKDCIDAAEAYEERPEVAGVGSK